jgi:glycosyltransferase involved in cell wall biosynthesis
MSARPIRVLELRSVRGTGGGPEKTILLGASQAKPNEFTITVCYLRDTRDTMFAIDERARAAGVDYVEVIERHSFDALVWSRLRELVRERGIQIVHAHEYKTDFLAWLLARAEGIVALATVHGWTGHSPRERYLYYPLDKQLLRRFPRLIAVSSQIRDDLIRAGVRPDRISTVLNGIDPQAFRRINDSRAHARAIHGLTDQDIVVGSIGRLEPQKRFDLLIEAAARLRGRYPTLRVLIAGEGSARPALAAAIDRLGLSAWCSLLGHRTDVVLLHHAFDLFVQSSDYEGTPNAVLEAMALETPIVATSAGGTAELVRDRLDGLIVPSGDLDALTRAMDEALASPAETAQRTANARRRVETDLSFEMRTRRVESIYRQLVASGEAGRPMIGRTA